MSWSDEALMNVFTENLNANKSVTTFKKFCIFIVICTFDIKYLQIKLNELNQTLFSKKY